MAAADVACNAGDSDYGSEFDAEQQEFVNQVLGEIPEAPEFTPFRIRDIEDNEGPSGAKVPSVLGQGRPQRLRASVSEAFNSHGSGAAIQIQFDRGGSTQIESPESRERRERSVSVDPESVNSIATNPRLPDLRSPLERFRTKPKKALSVTDLVSPSWCELQYWYTLTKFGKKRATPAMKQGTSIHKQLEDQVHVTIAVEAPTAEDAWGLRIWNVIQGLRTLRETGLTRELEVWGVIDGQVVNGVIDELSYLCPDRELEESSAVNGTKKTSQQALPSDQLTIQEFFKQNRATSGDRSTHVRTGGLPKRSSRIYITDVKTRSVKSVPQGASFRPTMMQLMLYHRLLSSLAEGKVDPAILFDRYRLKSSKTFSDNFMVSLSELYYDAPTDSTATTEDQDPSSSAQTTDTLQILLGHNDLNSLWKLLSEEIRLTFPDGAASIGTVLQAEYRTPTDGDILGRKTILYDDKLMSNYVDNELKWWRGERPAEGVCEEEAYKCGYCEFAEECTWRKEKIDQAVQRNRKAKEGQRRKSAV